MYGNYKNICNALRLNETVNLTNKTKIVATVSFTGTTTSTGYRYLFIADTLNKDLGSVMDAKVSCTNSGTTKQTVTLDVTSVSGNYYIGVGAYTESGSIGVYIHSLKVY